MSSLALDWGEIFAYLVFPPPVIIGGGLAVVAVARHGISPSEFEKLTYPRLIHLLQMLNLFNDEKDNYEGIGSTQADFEAEQIRYRQEHGLG